MQYAFLLTKTGKHEEAHQLLTLMSTSLPMAQTSPAQPAGPPPRKMALHLCIASCALYARDYHAAVDGMRYLMFRFQFNNGPLRVQAMLGHVMGFYGLDAFSETRIAKMVVRRMRTHEALVAGRPWSWTHGEKRYVIREKLGNSRVLKQGGSEGGMRAYSAATSSKAGSTTLGGSDEGGDSDEDSDDDGGRSASDRSASDGTPSVSGRGDDGATSTSAYNYGTTSVPNPAPAHAEPYPTKFTPVAELYYSFFLIASGSYQAALSYALRAYSRAPSDPLVCLAAACCCLARMTNRQVDNRHHLLVQAMGFLTLYRKLRGASALTGAHAEVAKQGRVSRASLEASYNVGRGFHAVGLLHMAVPQYEAVLRGHDANEGQQGQQGQAGMDVDADEGTTGFDPYREAAYNLALIYTINGNGRAARLLHEKYLVIGA